MLPLNIDPLQNDFVLFEKADNSPNKYKLWAVAKTFLKGSKLKVKKNTILLTFSGFAENLLKMEAKKQTKDYILSSKFSSINTSSFPDV